jgi:hypothetical protein
MPTHHALYDASAQGRFGPGSSSAPPLPAEPNFGLVTPPRVVRGGFGVVEAGEALFFDRSVLRRVVASFGVPSFGGGGVRRFMMTPA